MSTVESLLAELGLPTADLPDNPPSDFRFDEGTHARIEIPSVEGPEALQTVVQEAAQRGLPLHRVSQGSGIMLLTDDDVREMARIGAEHNVEVCLFVGPRAPWEGTAQALTPDGKLFGWRHTGMDQLKYGFEDVERAVELGIRSVLVADEGLTYLIGEARKRGNLPADLVVKGSALLGAANPLGIKLLADAGMDTINVASDASCPRLAALRAVVPIPIDLYIESPDGMGGFTRYHELPDIVRVAAPVHLKFGLRNAPNIYPSGIHLQPAAVATARERVRRAAIGLELLQRKAPELVPAAPAGGRGVPVA